MIIVVLIILMILTCYCEYRYAKIICNKYKDLDDIWFDED